MKMTFRKKMSREEHEGGEGVSIFPSRNFAAFARNKLFCK